MSQTVQLDLSSGKKISLDLKRNLILSLEFESRQIGHLDFAPPIDIALEFQKFIHDELAQRQQIQLLDESRPVAYAGFSNRIMRLEYYQWPPTISTCSTSNLSEDWPNRSALIYS